MVETKPPNPDPIPDAPKGEPGKTPTQPLSLPTNVGFDFGSFFIAVFVVALMATVVAAGYRYIMLAATLTEQRQQIASLESELTDPQLMALEQQVTEIAGGIDRIKPILDEKIRYAELFWTMRKVTEQSVRWTSFGYSENQQVSLVGEGAGWGSIARQLAILKQTDKFSQVELTSAALQPTEGGARVSFSVTLQVDPAKLVPPEQ
jgi:hypothetical protein